MAKLPKKPTAKAAKTPAAKKSAKPKTAAKSSAKKPAAKKPATKTFTAKKAVGKKATAKKAVSQKPAAKTAKKVAKKPKPGGKKVSTQTRTTTPIALLTAPEPASPTIGPPANGASVPANTDLNVSVGTNRTDLDYTITVVDDTANPPVVVKTLPANAPVTNPFMVTVPGNVLAPGRAYKIKVTTNPAAGNNSDEITVTTGPSTNPGGGE